MEKINPISKKAVNLKKLLTTVKKNNLFLRLFFPNFKSLKIANIVKIYGYKVTLEKCR